MENDEKALQEELARIEVTNKPKPLTQANLDAASRKSASSKAKKGKKGAGSKPAWAMTE